MPNKANSADAKSRAADFQSSLEPSQMRLIGSRMEQDFRNELLLSHSAIQDPESHLNPALKGNGYSTSRAYVLHWTPEQLENIYVVLIDKATVVKVEIDKLDQTVLPETYEMEKKGTDLFSMTDTHPPKFPADAASPRR